MFTRVFGLLTFSKALLQYSLFKVLYFAQKSKQTGNLAVKLMFAMEILLMDRDFYRWAHLRIRMTNCVAGLRHVGCCLL